MLSSVFTGEGILGLICIAAMLLISSFPNVASVSAATSGMPADRRSALWLTWTAAVLFLRMFVLITLLWLIHADVSLTSLFGNEVKLREFVLLGVGFYLLSRIVIQVVHYSDWKPIPSKGIAVSTVAPLFARSIPHAADGAFLAFGMSDSLPVMVAGIFLGAILVASGQKWLTALTARLPVLYSLTLGFALLVSLLILIEGVAGPALRISKTYIYFVIAFGFGVLLLSLRNRRNRQIS
jgi:predicted tellurium resistance membrane protein TerC